MQNTQRSPTPPLVSLLRPVLAVAATYTYFLLYAQFGFLKLLRERLGSAAEVEPVMATMGIAGLLASFGAALLLKRFDARRLLLAGFAGAGLTALAALAVDGEAAFAVVAALIGVSTALITVVLAAHLGDFVGDGSLPLAVGLGTGLPYFFCNVPGLFEGGPALQSGLAAAACAVGLLAVPGTRGGRTADVLPQRDYVRWAFASVVLAFLALIWLDSAAFAIIQETAALKGQTWGSAAQKILQGSVHLLAAIAAGEAIRRGLFRSLLLGTYGVFAVAFLLLESGFGVAGPLYAIGISTYSVALVVYPGAHRDADGILPRRWRAALVFGIAGWLGSALGVGMAQNLHRIPHFFLAGAGVVVLAAAAVGRPLPGLVRAHVGTLLGLAAGLAVYLPSTGAPPPTESADRVAAGRRVYVQEGCLHCHSQYVRTRTADVELWGPFHDASQEEPPLYGNRRQGPDLSNAGNRRSAAWHRLHLRQPRALVPSSRMPSYESLFEDEGEGRGEALVAYLASLGAADQDARFAITQNADLHVDAGDPVDGQRLFTSYCMPCHGAEGRGDGPLAEAVHRPAMNLRKGAFWLVSWGPGADESLAAGLARVIKFGVSGTSMPGHEYLRDDEIADLAAFVVKMTDGDEAPRPDATKVAEAAAYEWP